MSKPKNTEETREKLAHEVVDSWDMDDLITYAIDKLEEYYKSDEEGFQADWKTMYCPD